MDNFNVPKKINRNVLKALSVLHESHSITAFVPADTIVRQVELQMRSNKNHVEQFVLKSLCSLTHLGIVVRTGASDYALRQSLEFSNGASAIPWRRLPNNLANDTTAKRPSSSKSAISKCKIRKSGTLLKPVKRSIKKTASKGKISPFRIKNCVVVCTDFLAKRKNDKRKNDKAQCDKMGDDTANSANLWMTDSRFEFSSPISLVDSQGC